MQGCLMTSMYPMHLTLVKGPFLHKSLFFPLKYAPGPVPANADLNSGP